MNFRTRIIHTALTTANDIATVAPISQVFFREIDHRFIDFNHDNLLNGIMLKNFSQRGTLAATDTQVIDRFTSAP